MKNVIKAVKKKLKLWSKKKRKKTHQHDCCSSSTTQPSAPPLPCPSSWLQVEYNYDYGTFLPPPPEVAQPQEIRTDSSLVSRTPNSSHQQYMISVTEPVYGIPVPASQN
ncbi:hypothetical protein CR513_08347, partial [Mucuna pruriens]